MPVLSKFAAFSSIDWDYGDVVEFTARARAVLAESYNILDMRLAGLAKIDQISIDI